MPAALPLTVGIDVGGTHTKLALVDGDGEISSFRRLPTEAASDPEPFLSTLTQQVGELIALGGADVIGIGMSLHGYVDDRGPIVCPNTPALRGLDLHGLMVDRFGLPVIVNNDLTAHTLAEYHFGSGRGTRRFMVMAMGTGLGAGVIIDGQALRYAGGCAGDTGHVIIQPGGPECSMGCKGCAEALIGTPGIERLAKERTGRDVPAHQVIAGAREGQPEMVAIMVQIGEWLGLALATLSVIYLPERIALTGGQAEAGKVLLDATERRFRELVGTYHERTARMTDLFYRRVEFVLGEMRSQTGVVGAVAELLRPIRPSGGG